MSSSTRQYRRLLKVRHQHKLWGCCCAGERAAAPHAGWCATRSMARKPPRHSAAGLKNSNGQHRGCAGPAAACMRGRAAGFAQRPARPPALASLRSAPRCDLPGCAGPARRQGAHRSACLEAFFCFFRSAAFRRFSRSRSAGVSFRSPPLASGPLACGCAPCAAPSGPSMLPFASASTAADSSRTMLGPAAGPPSASRPPRTQEELDVELQTGPREASQGWALGSPGSSARHPRFFIPRYKRVCQLRRPSPPMTLQWIC